MTTVTSDPNSLFMTTVTTDSFVSPIDSASLMTSPGTAPSSPGTVTESSTSSIAFESTVTQAPAFESTVTQGPAFESTVTQGPAFESTVTHGPAFESTVTQGPAFESTVTQGPAFESTVTQGPAFESTVTHGPAFESTVTHRPAFASTGTHGPAFESTGTHEPSTIPNKHAVVTTMNKTFCTEPLPIAGGSTISSGPYIANASSVVFSCYTGYSMSGSAQVVCNAAGKWASKFPQCVPIDNHPKVDNIFTFNQDSGAVPFWLLIVLAVALGLLCLLLLTCVLLFCLKIFGCWKGGLCFQSKLGSARRVHDSDMFRDDFSQRDAYRSRRTHYEDEERNTRPNRRSDLGMQTSRISKETTTEPAVVRGWDVNKFRREARMPAKLTWMPHSNSVRHYNTSTK